MNHPDSQEAPPPEEDETEAAPEAKPGDIQAPEESKPQAEPAAAPETPGRGE